MANARLINTPTVIDNGEDIQNWNGDTFSLEPDIKVQGDNSVACVITPNAGNSQEVYVSTTTGWDFSGGGEGDQHLRFWLNISFAGNLQTEANDGCSMYVSDGANFSYWTIFGSDTYAGGWQQFVIYSGSTPTSTTGTVDMSALTQLGLHFEALTKPRNVPANTWLDMWTYGDGYTVTGSDMATATDSIDWSDIAARDLLDAFNIVREVDSVFFLAGEVTIGDSSSTTYFSPSNQIAVFKDLPVLDTLYQIIFADTSSTYTHIDMAGGAWTAAGLQRYTIDASTILADFAMNGLQISRHDGATFHAGATIENTVFNDCLQTVPGLSVFTDNTITNSTSTGAILHPVDDDFISDLIFINNDNGVEYNSLSDGIDPKFDNFVFDDVSGKYDVNNTTSTPVLIILANGGNANSYNPTLGTAVTFQSSLQMTVTIKDKDTLEPILGVQTAIKEQADPTNLLMNEDTIAGGIATEAYVGATPLTVVVTGRKSDAADDPRYFPASQIGVLETGQNFNLTILMEQNVFLTP